MLDKFLTLKELGIALGFKSYDGIKDFIKSHSDVPHVLTGAKNKRKVYRLESVKRWLDDYEMRCTQANIHNKKN